MFLAMARMSQSRGWCFTVNNPSVSDKLSIQELNDHPDILGLVVGIEVGEEGTPHLQGVIQLKKKKRLGGVKTYPGFHKAHLERRNGSWRQAAEYCRKDGNLLVDKDWKEEQGNRTDLNEFGKRVLDGTMDVLDDITMVAKYPKLEGRLLQERARRLGHRWREVKVLVLWGKAGTGKSKAAMYEDGELKKDMYVVPKTDNLKWWDGYSGESIIILNDFWGSRCKHDKLLDILDGHPMMVETKGGFTWAAWTEVIITSNKHPDDWYTCDYDVDAFQRRFTEIKRF